MKVTFPHMGNAYIPIKALLDDLNVKYVIPPFNNKKALEIGTRYAPELACLPLKINLGNYIQAYDEGADTILIAGGCGPCRFGYYGEMHREILKDTNYDMDVIILETPNSNYKEFLERIKRITGTLNIYKIIRAIKNAAIVSCEADELEKLCFYLRPRQIIKGEVDEIFRNFLKKIQNFKGTKEIRKYIKKTREQLIHTKINRNLSPIKIGLVGEIFTCIDWFSNLYLEQKLGNMGIEVDRSITVSGWIIEHMIKNALSLPKDLRYAKAAKPYLSKMIGGHAQETIGNTILYKQNDYDGVIQTYPLTCMPEIVAESILPAVQRDFEIPVLTLIIDEMTGENGYLTRIEAFVDLIKRRKELISLEKKYAFSRC